MTVLNYFPLEAENARLRIGDVTFARPRIGPMMVHESGSSSCIFILAVVLFTPLAAAEDSGDYHHVGELAGSLKTSTPLPLFDPDPGHS